MPKIKLKPCPFCGSETLCICTTCESLPNIFTFIKCASCGMRGPYSITPYSLHNDVDNDAEIAAEKWNKRDKEEAAEKILEEFVAMADSGSLCSDCISMPLTINCRREECEGCKVFDIVERTSKFLKEG